MNPRIIVADLDSTLLRSDKTISDYSIDVLTKCKDSGIKIVFATARSENACRRFVDAISPDAIISNGGARARIGEKTIYYAAMDRNITNGVIQSCLKNKSMGYLTVDTDMGCFVNMPIDESDQDWQDVSPVIYTNFLEYLSCDAYKVLVNFSDNTVADVIASEFSSVDVMRFSNEHWYHFANKSARKWSALQAVMCYFKCDTKDVVAFGDNYNDVEMLKCCGIGVSVENATAEAKVVSDYICNTNDNDGVATWIYENVL